MVSLMVSAVLTSSFVMQMPDMGGKAKAEAMKKMEWMVGEWRGKGWADRGGHKTEFNSYEKIEPKAGGTVYALTGYHTADIPGKDPIVVHDAFGVVTFDLQKKNYTMTSSLANGLSMAFTMDIVENGYNWTSPGEHGPITYKAKLEKGVWVEQGFEDREGKPTLWYEMRLTKQPGIK